MLEQLMVILARANPTEPTRGPSRPRIKVPRPAALCWRCGTRRHLRLSCPQPRKWLNSRGPRTPLKPRGPGKKKPRVGTAGRPYEHRGILPASGRHPVGPADQTGDMNRSHCLSLTGSAGYQRWSWLARSIQTSEGNKPPRRGRILAPRGPTDQTGTVPFGQDRTRWGSRGTTTRR